LSTCPRRQDLYSIRLFNFYQEPIIRCIQSNFFYTCFLPLKTTNDAFMYNTFFVCCYDRCSVNRYKDFSHAPQILTGWIYRPLTLTSIWFWHNIGVWALKSTHITCCYINYYSFDAGGFILMHNHYPKLLYPCTVLYYTRGRSFTTGCRCMVNLQHCKRHVVFFGIVSQLLALSKLEIEDEFNHFFSWNIWKRWVLSFF
jgi:hypothetical protein